MRIKKDDRFIFIMIATFMWGIFAHGYCYFNMFNSHDSLHLNAESLTPFFVSIGRFMLPVFTLLAGNFSPSTYVGFWSMAFIGVVIWLVTEIFDIKNRLAIFVLSGLLVVNVSITLLNATYITLVLPFTFAALLAVFSVYLFQKIRHGFVLGIITICCSLGTYQAYFQVAVFLFMILAVMDILRQNDFSDVMKNGLKAVLMLAGGGTLILCFGKSDNDVYRN